MKTITLVLTEQELADIISVLEREVERLDDNGFEEAADKCSAIRWKLWKTKQEQK